MSDKDVGIYRKFKVERTDGSSFSGGKHEDCRYFVLDLDHDRFADDALLAHALACKMEYPRLASDLIRIICDTEAGREIILKKARTGLSAHGGE